MPDFFINRAGRVRSFWRLLIFVVAYLCVTYPAFLIVQFGLALLLSRETYEWLLAESGWGFVFQSVMLFATAAVAGWGQLLRGGERLGDWGHDEAVALALANRGADPYGYRTEAVQLMRLAQSLAQ